MVERRSPSSIVKKSTSCRKHTVPSNYRARLEDLSVITRDILKADGLQEMLRLTAGAANHVVHGCAGIAIYGRSAAWDAKTNEAIAEHISENVNISHFKNESFYNMLVKEKHSVCLKGKFFTDASTRQTLFHKRPTFRSLVGVPLLTNDGSDIQGAILVDSGKCGNFGRKDVELLDRLAGFVAPVLRTLEVLPRSQTSETETNFSTTISQNKSEYRKLADQLDSLIVNLDENGRIVYVNDYTLKLFGYSQEKVFKQDVRKIYSPEKQLGRIRSKNEFA